MLGGAPSSGAQKYADALAANGLVEGQPVEFLDPETQEWRRGTVAGLKPSTTEKAWQSFLDKELVRVEMLTDSGEKKWWVCPAFAADTQADLAVFFGRTRVTLSPDCIRPVQDPAPAQDAAPAQGPADPPDPASAVTPSKRSLSPEPEEESPSKRQKPESRSLSSKAKGKWRVSDRPEPTEPNEPALLSASDLIPEEVDLFSQFDNLRAVCGFASLFCRRSSTEIHFSIRRKRKRLRRNGMRLSRS